MRPGQQNKRLRGRNRKGPNPLTRSYESNGPDVKIRGTALHIAEKYVQLARDAQSSGDRVAGESYLQHAEHYYRIIAAAQAAMPQPQAFYRNDEGDDDEEGDERPFGGNDRSRQPNGFHTAPGYEGQPFVNPNGNGGGHSPPAPVGAPDQPRLDAPQQFAPDDRDDDGGFGPDYSRQPGEFQGLPPGEFRSRRRRSNRGRGRRPEGGDTQPQEAGEGRMGGGESQPAPSRDPEFLAED